MSSIQPRKQRLARYTAPYHRRHREMSAPIDRGLRERQLSRGFMYPRAMPVRKGDRVMVADLDFPSPLTTITRSPFLTGIALGYINPRDSCLSRRPRSIGADISRCLR
jgi:hypothetical protein